MRVDRLTDDKRIQALMRSFAESINERVPLVEARSLFQERPFYSLLKDDMGTFFTAQLQSVADKLESEADAERHPFVAAVRDTPDIYVRYMIEDAIDKAHDRQMGAPEQNDLEQLLMPVDGASFRRFHQQPVYFRSALLLNAMQSSGFPSSLLDDGIAAYGYIDTQAGLSFKGICCANLSGNQVRLSPTSETVGMAIRASSVSDACFLNLMQTNCDLFEFEPIVEMTRVYEPEPQVATMRKYDFLDYSRHPQYPDDVKVILYDEQFPQEIVWVRCQSADSEQGLLYGRLLNEPNNAFGVHRGDTVAFRAIQDEDGHELCLHLKSYK